VIVRFITALLWLGCLSAFVLLVSALSYLINMMGCQ